MASRDTIYRLGAYQITDTILMPEYAALFRCDGSACGSYCCHDWRIPLYEGDIALLQSLDVEQRAAIMDHLRERGGSYETIPTPEGRCPFLSADGLCFIQRAHGEKMLPGICFTYPRIIFRFAGLTELSLTLSCPVAARLALTGREPIRFIQVDYKLPERALTLTPRAETKDFYDIQRVAIAMLQRRELPLAARFAALIELGERLDANGGAVGQLAAEVMGETPAFGFSPETITARVSFLAEAFELPLTTVKIAELSRRYAGIYPAFRQSVNDMPHIVENLAVNECFMRLYPCAVSGSYAFNFAHLALIVALISTSLLAEAAKHDGTLTPDAAITMVGHAASRIDHSHSTINIISGIIRREFSEPVNIVSLFDSKAYGVL